MELLYQKACSFKSDLFYLLRFSIHVRIKHLDQLLQRYKKVSFSKHMSNTHTGMQLVSQCNIDYSYMIKEKYSQRYTYKNMMHTAFLYIGQFWTLYGLHVPIVISANQIPCKVQCHINNGYCTPIAVLTNWNNEAAKRLNGLDDFVPFHCLTHSHLQT